MPGSAHDDAARDGDLFNQTLLRTADAEGENTGDLLAARRRGLKAQLRLEPAGLRGVVRAREPLAVLLQIELVRVPAHAAIRSFALEVVRIVRVHVKAVLRTHGGDQLTLPAQLQ